MNPNQLIEEFRDTQNQVQNCSYLSEKTSQMQKKTMLYLPRFDAVVHTAKCHSPIIEVVEDTTLHCAYTQIHPSNKTAILNFANAYSPGGGVTVGASAQEEYLCRLSNLYSSLTMPYLLRNYYKWNKKNTGDMGTDAVIYSPGVTVLKDDHFLPFTPDQYFEVDVLTCAAPYYDLGRKKPVVLSKLADILYYRIKNILEVAVSNDVDVLILGAFGCGAFHNPPELVADIFNQLLVKQNYGTYFKKVVFAILGNHSGSVNFEVFRDTFAR